MKTLSADAPAAGANAHRVVLPGCKSLLNVFFKTHVFFFVSHLFSYPKCSLLAVHIPHPHPQSPVESHQCLWLLQFR